MYVRELYEYILKLFYEFKHLFVHREFYAKIIKVCDIMHIKIGYNYFYYNYKLADIYIPKYADKSCIDWVVNNMILYMTNKVYKIKIIKNKCIYLHDTYNNIYINNWINNLIIEYTINEALYKKDKSKTI